MKYKAVALYRHRKTGAYLVQPMTRHPTGASAEFGEPTIVSAEEFESRIAPVTREHLASYGTQEFRPEAGRKFSAKEYAKFKREHDSISVTELENGLLEITPDRRVRGGYVGHREDMLVLKADCAAGELAEAIREAFSRAG